MQRNKVLRRRLHCSATHRRRSDQEVQRRYGSRKNELKAAPDRKDMILSQITQIMYSYSLTVDLKTKTYSLITGTGMERTVAEYKRHDNYNELLAFHAGIVHSGISWPHKRTDQF